MMDDRKAGRHRLVGFDHRHTPRRDLSCDLGVDRVRPAEQGAFHHQQPGPETGRMRRRD